MRKSILLVEDNPYDATLMLRAFPTVERRSIKRPKLGRALDIRLTS